MSTLSQKMKTARLDYATPASKLFIPFNEGAGNTASDIIGDVVITDDATAEWTTGHAGDFIVTANTAIGGTLPVVSASQSAILYVFQKVVTLSAFTGLVLGNSAAASISVNAGSGHVKLSDGTVVPLGGALTVADGEHFGAAVFLNRNNNTLKKFGSVESAGFSEVISNSAATLVGEIAPLSQATFSTTFAMHYYAIGMAVYDTPPSDADLIAALDETYANVIQGYKYTTSPL